MQSVNIDAIDEEEQGWLNPSRDKDEGKHRRGKGGQKPKEGEKHGAYSFLWDPGWPV